MSAGWDISHLSCYLCPLPCVAKRGSTKKGAAPAQGLQWRRGRILPSLGTLPCLSQGAFGVNKRQGWGEL